jgi:arsenate reductase
MLLNIQIFGKTKCFETQKAERYFKERRIRFQMVDVRKYGMSRGELMAVIRALGGLEAVLDPKAKDYPLLRYLAYEEDKLEKLLENPELLKTPIVRNGRLATVGYRPEIWKTWEEAAKGNTSV